MRPFKVGDRVIANKPSPDYPHGNGDQWVGDRHPRWKLGDKGIVTEVPSRQHLLPTLRVKHESQGPKDYVWYLALPQFSFARCSESEVEVEVPSLTGERQ